MGFSCTASFSQMVITFKQIWQQLILWESFVYKPGKLIKGNNSEIVFESWENS
jgi:hypothetical protein